jgi:hypothetical protein
MVAAINDRFVDVDFTKEAEFVAGDLGFRAMHNFASYNRVAQILTDEELEKEMERAEETGGLENLITVILNQMQEGSCVGNGFVGAYMTRWNAMFGKEYALLMSANSLYKQIGATASSGAMVNDGIDRLMDTGILPLDTPENRKHFDNIVMPATGFRVPFPNDWKNTAKLFKGSSYYIVKSVNELLTALARQQPVIVGREGHCIYYCRGMRKVIRGRSQRCALYCNSWGKWGMGAGDFDYGFGIDTEAQIAKSARWAVVLTSVVRPSMLETWYQTAV